MAGLAVFGVAALLAGCASAPETGGGSSDKPAASDFLPCIVSDFGGFDDKSFNQSSYEGMVAAADELGIEFKEAESTSEDQYSGNVTGMVDQGCNLIVTVGFALANATRDAAKENPDTNFALIDSALSNDDFSPLVLPNVKPVLYDTAQAAFLAGYLAAGTTKTGVVGTFGGQAFPSVTIFMDGFADGVAYYNQAKGTAVQVKGWDVAAQDGTFTGGFDANETAKTAAQGLIDAGADILLPVGGPIYQSAAEAIIDSGKDIALIGVDSDLFETDPSYADMYLTSIKKEMTDAIKSITVDAANGKFDGTAYVGTLENKGVGLAPLHNWESKVDPALWEEVQALIPQIISGDIEVVSPSSPK